MEKENGSKMLKNVYNYVELYQCSANKFKALPRPEIFRNFSTISLTNFLINNLLDFDISFLTIYHVDCFVAEI